jgi:hypothetical protein
LFYILAKRLFSAAILMVVTGHTLLAATQDLPPSEPRFLADAKAPDNISPVPSNGNVVIAIVDDGVRVSHREVNAFIWKNPREIPDNYKDDDGNGHVDDVQGWDVSDDDNDVAPPQEKLNEYYHGTHLAGIITQIARKACGPEASRFIQILPVKCVADEAERKYLKEGYRGIEYAIQAGADIIVCAWGMNHISQNERQVLERARGKGILVVASAGNFPQESDQYPAAHEAVLAVAALDRASHPWENSNYGDFVDIVAPGEAIESSAALDDSATTVRTGTSPATAIVAAAAALVKLQHPDYDSLKIKACLLSAADFLDITDPQYASKYGAGKINIAAAVDGGLFSGETQKENLSHKPDGVLHYRPGSHSRIAWTLQPYGLVKGFRFQKLDQQPFASGGRILFYAEPTETGKPYKGYLLEDLPDTIYIPAQGCRVVFEKQDAVKNPGWTLAYHCETDRAATLYCSGTTPIIQPGTLNDGSGSEDYAPGTDCKWQVTAPKGKVVHFKFTEFQTEAKTDLLYFFNGAGTHEKIMAIFSGPHLPPELTTWSNHVLVWFVTNKENQAAGWQANVEFIDPPEKPDLSPQETP